MDKDEISDHSKFSAGRLHSPPPMHHHQDPFDAIGATTTVPLDDSLSPHVQFAARSPSIIPTPIYDESSFADPSSPMPILAPPIPMHAMSSQGINTPPATSAGSRNFATDTFQPAPRAIPPQSSGEKTAQEDYGPRFADEDEGRAQYELGSTAPAIHQRGPGGSSNFMRLDSDTIEQRGQYAPVGGRTSRGDTTFPGFTQPYGANRGLLMRALLGPVSRPWFSWITGVVMLCVMIYEFVRNQQLTGYLIETSPFNPMVGPSFTVLVNVGAKFTPCMRSLPEYSLSSTFASCFRPDATCTLETACGFGGFGGETPNQTFRFFTPIFLHAGVIHYLINMLTHLRLGADLERALGIPRYAALYFASGIWGVVLSSMLAPSTSASMGCSGALFGLIGYMFIDVIVNWKNIKSPVRELMSLLISTIISLVLGLLPGLDNFAHMGGFAVGIVMGVLISPMRTNASKSFRIGTWIARVVAFVLLIIMFVVTIKAFYSSEDPSKICPNCKYLSCLPVSNWCDL